MGIPGDTYRDQCDRTASSVSGIWDRPVNPELPLCQCPELVSVIGEPTGQNEQERPLGEALPWRLNAHHKDGEQPDGEDCDTKRDESVWIIGPPVIVIESPRRKGDPQNG